jgi:hypothetical protein
MSSLGEALAGRLVGWRGLGALDEAALRAELGELERDPVVRPRGARGFQVLRAGEVEAWFPGGSETAATVEFAPAADLDGEELLADLGEPELVLDSNHFAVGAVVSDYVYAARGITVSVAQPFEDGARSVVYVQLYAPTTTQAYVTEIGQSGEQIQPYPRSD